MRAVGLDVDGGQLDGLGIQRDVRDQQLLAGLADDGAERLLQAQKREAKQVRAAAVGEDDHVAPVPVGYHGAGDLGFDRHRGDARADDRFAIGAGDPAGQDVRILGGGHGGQRQQDQNDQSTHHSHMFSHSKTVSAASRAPP